MSLFQLLIARSAQGTTSVGVTCHVGLTVLGRELENETAFLSPWTHFPLLFPHRKCFAPWWQPAATATSKSWLDLIPSNFYCTWQITVS